MPRKEFPAGLTPLVAGGKFRASAHTGAGAPDIARSSGRAR